MNRLKSVLAAAVLTLVMAGAVAAGETLTPPCVPGETLTPPCSSSATEPGETQTPPASESVEIFSLVRLALDSLLLF